jgi:hypothetical protein
VSVAFTGKTPDEAYHGLPSVLAGAGLDVRGASTNPGVGRTSINDQVVYGRVGKLSVDRLALTYMWWQGYRRQLQQRRRRPRW